jgi:small subunit ribosomal protein S17
VGRVEWKMTGQKKIRLGEVVSDKMDKAIVVRVERRFSHPVYKKTVKRSTRLKVHDEKNECRVGDRVRVIETRPLSKDKRWRVLEIVERGTDLSSVEEAPEAGVDHD